MPPLNFETIKVSVPRLPEGFEPIQWSPFQRSSYTILQDGERIGIGMHPIFDVVLGAWNLLWLSWPMIDDLIFWDKDPAVQQFPYHPEILPAVVASCLQTLEGGGNYGTCVECLTPLNFMKLLQSLQPQKVPFILMHLYGPDWVNLAMDRAKLYKAPHEGERGIIIPFDLSRRRQ